MANAFRTIENVMGEVIVQMDLMNHFVYAIQVSALLSVYQPGLFHPLFFISSLYTVDLSNITTIPSKCASLNLAHVDR